MQVSHKDRQGPRPITKIVIHFCFNIFCRANCSWDKQQFLATEEEHFTQERSLLLDVRQQRTFFWLSQFDYNFNLWRKIGLKPKLNTSYSKPEREQYWKITSAYTFYSLKKRQCSNSVFCMHDWFQKSNVFSNRQVSITVFWKLLNKISWMWTTF